jgi:hypothetical protein
VRSPGRDRRAGRANRAGSTGPRSGPRRGPHGSRPGAGASRRGRAGTGRTGPQTGARARGGGALDRRRRAGRVGGREPSGGTQVGQHHGTKTPPGAPPAPARVLSRWGPGFFPFFGFGGRLGPLKSAADGRVWCHNFAKPERNEVVAPHVVHVPTRQPISDGRRDRGAVVPQLRQIRAKRSFVTTRSSASSACLVPCPLQTKP